MTRAKERQPPQFDAAFRAQLAELVRWRRDVRRFRSDPIDPTLLEKLLALSACAPSVGLSQPWRFVLVESAERRLAIRDNFSQANKSALEGYGGGGQGRDSPLQIHRR